MKLLVLCLSAGILLSSAPAQLPRISTDLREAVNRGPFLKAVPLTAAHKAVLRKNGFVQFPSKDIVLYNVYGTNQYERVPALLTVDNILQIYHLFFDSTLRSVEESQLLPELEKLTSGMVTQTQKRLEQVKGTPLEGAARKNLAYFVVAQQLLNQKAVVPTEVTDMVSTELRRIGDHKDFEDSAIFPYKFDYSQFAVRGHYERTADLGRYFKTMMWYGLVPFALERRVGQVSEMLPEQIQEVSLIPLDLEQAGVADSWNKIYGVSSLYAGKSNRLTPFEWEALMRGTLGGVDALKALAQPEVLSKLLKASALARRPDIVTKKDDAAVASDIQVRFMGQRAIPDSVIFNRLTDPDVRPMPSGLDVASVLGSARAAQLLDGNPALSQASKWPGYRAERTALKGKYSSLDQATWSQDLYWSWLDVLRTQFAPPAAGVPAVFRTSAWQDHQLSTALASWAELRHDTLLYGEQTVSEMGDGDEPPFVKGYVEPNSQLYARMLKLVDQTQAGLKTVGALSEEETSLFDDFRSFTQFLIKVTDKELHGVKLTREEHNHIQLIESELEGLNTSIQTVGQNFRQLSEDQLNMAQVADVHTAQGQALTVAVGVSDDLVAIVPIEGKLTLVRGSSFSYYEFLQPISDRLTDSKWKARVGAGKAPARPSWTKSFFVNLPARATDQ